MTREEFNAAMRKETAKVREAFIEMHKLLNEDYKSEWNEANGLETYHIVKDALYDTFMNGAHLVDDYLKKDVGTEKSCVYKSRRFLIKHNL